MLHSAVNRCACASPLTSTIAIIRDRQATRLQPFLQPRLRILAEHRRIRIAQHVAERAVDDVARGLEAAVEEHGAVQRLQRVGEDRRAVRSPAPLLAFAELDRRRPGPACARSRRACRGSRGSPARGTGRLRRSPGTGRRARARRRSSAPRRRRTRAARCGARRGCDGSAPARAGRAGETSNPAARADRRSLRRSLRSCAQPLAQRALFRALPAGAAGPPQGARQIQPR